MRVLVTGATGFIGGHVVDACLAAGHEVRALVRSATPSERLERIGVEVAPGDISEASSARSAVRGTDAVLHLAALYTFRAADPGDFQRANVDGALNVVRAAGDAGVRVVHCSTVGAIGGSAEPRALDETAEWNLTETGDPYIVTKRRAEEAVLALARDVDVVVVNPSGPVGERDVKPTPTGELIVRFCDGLVRFWVGGGLNLVDVRDVAAGHLLALEKGRTGERYILGGEDLTFRGVVERLAAVTGLPGPLVGVPHPLALGAAHAVERASRWLNRPPLVTASQARASRLYLWASSEKARRELGYDPRPLDQALELATRWFAEHGYVRIARAKRILSR